MVMPPLEMNKVIIAYNSRTVGEFKEAIHGQNDIHIISPISVFISITVPADQYDKFNVMEITKEVTAQLAYDKLIHNISQIKEVAIEKKKGLFQICACFYSKSKIKGRWQYI